MTIFVLLYDMMNTIKENMLLKIPKLLVLYFTVHVLFSAYLEFGLVGADAVFCVILI